MWGAWCARCHAADGTGKIDEPTVKVEPMDFTDCRLTTAEPDADWERAIAKGGPGRRPVAANAGVRRFADAGTDRRLRLAHPRVLQRTGWPSGNTNFPRPILTEKAFPENEFLILPAISHEREVSRSTALYERRLGKRSMFEIGVPIENDGVGDVDFAFKHAMHAARSTSSRSDSRPRSRKDTAIFEPFVSAGTMLRDWYLQGQVKVELPVDRDKADRAFVYNAYLGRDTSQAPNTWTLGVELNGENHELADAAGPKRADGHRSARGLDRRDGADQRTGRTGSAMGRILALGILGTLACAQVAARATGSISGTISTSAKGATPVRVTIDQKICGNELPDEAIVVDALGHLANACDLTGLKAPCPRKPLSATRSAASRRACSWRGRRRTFARPARIPSFTPLRLSSRMAARLFNVALPMPGLNISKPIGGAGTVRLNCNTHPWMRGWMIVTDDAAAISGADGKFTIDNVPPGTYELRVWHEALKGSPQKITIAAGKPTEFNCN